MSILKTFMLAIITAGPNTGTVHLHDQHETKAVCIKHVNAYTHGYYNGIATAFCLSLPPCEWEDSENCYWDAQKQGNGKGQSFIDFNGKIHQIEIK